MQLKIKGRKYWLWQAVDRDGLVLDILVQGRRNQEAADDSCAVYSTERSRRRGSW